jgi:hypothetical protein
MIYGCTDPVDITQEEYEDSMSQFRRAGIIWKQAVSAAKAGMLPPGSVTFIADRTVHSLNVGEDLQEEYHRRFVVKLMRGNPPAHEVARDLTKQGFQAEWLGGTLIALSGEVDFLETRKGFLDDSDGECLEAPFFIEALLKLAINVNTQRVRATYWMLEAGHGWKVASRMSTSYL